MIRLFVPGGFITAVIDRSGANPGRVVEIYLGLRQQSKPVLQCRNKKRGKQKGPRE
ncbi:MAG TPA: hypothetical protein VEX65_09785 [Flavisolibacter sp.]|nr:hypothetical protein [Flavisolibacter sp.]